MSTNCSKHQSVAEYDRAAAIGGGGGGIGSSSLLNSSKTSSILGGGDSMTTGPSHHNHHHQQLATISAAMFASFEGENGGGRHHNRASAGGGMGHSSSAVDVHNNSSSGLNNMRVPPSVVLSTDGSAYNGGVGFGGIDGVSSSNLFMAKTAPTLGGGGSSRSILSPADSTHSGMSGFGGGGGMGGTSNNIIVGAGKARQFDFKSQTHIKKILERRQQVARGNGIVDRLTDMPSLQLPPMRSNLPTQRNALESLAGGGGKGGGGSKSLNGTINGGGGGGVRSSRAQSPANSQGVGGGLSNVGSRATTPSRIGGLTSMGAAMGTELPTTTIGRSSRLSMSLAAAGSRAVTPSGVAGGGGVGSPTSPAPSVLSVTNGADGNNAAAANGGRSASVMAGGSRPSTRDVRALKNSLYEDLLNETLNATLNGTMNGGKSGGDIPGANGSSTRLPKINTAPGTFTLEHPKLLIKVVLTEDPYTASLQQAVGVSTAKRILDRTHADGTPIPKEHGESDGVQHFRVEERLFFTEREKHVLEERRLAEKHTATLGKRNGRDGAGQAGTPKLYHRPPTKFGFVDVTSSSDDEDGNGSGGGGGANGMGDEVSDEEVYKSERQRAKAARRAERAVKKAAAKRKWQQEAVMSVLKPTQYERKTAVRRDVELVTDLGALAGERQLVAQRLLVRQEQRANQKAFHSQIKASNQQVNTMRMGGKGKYFEMVKSAWEEKQQLSLLPDGSTTSNNRDMSLHRKTSRSALFRDNNRRRSSVHLLDGGNKFVPRPTTHSILVGGGGDKASEQQQLLMSSSAPPMLLPPIRRNTLGEMLPPVDDHEVVDFSGEDGGGAPLTSFFFTQPEPIEASSAPTTTTAATSGTAANGNTSPAGAVGGTSDKRTGGVTTATAMSTTPRSRSGASPSAKSSGRVGDGGGGVSSPNPNTPRNNNNRAGSPSSPKLRPVFDIDGVQAFKHKNVQRKALPTAADDDTANKPTPLPAPLQQVQDRILALARERHAQQMKGEDPTADLLGAAAATKATKTATASGKSIYEPANVSLYKPSPSAIAGRAASKITGNGFFSTSAGGGAAAGHNTSIQSTSSGGQSAPINAKQYDSDGDHDDTSSSDGDNNRDYRKRPDKKGGAYCNIHNHPSDDNDASDDLQHPQSGSASSFNSSTTDLFRGGSAMDFLRHGSRNNRSFKKQSSRAGSDLGGAGGAAYDADERPLGVGMGGAVLGSKKWKKKQQNEEDSALHQHHPIRFGDSETAADDQQRSPRVQTVAYGPKGSPATLINVGAAAVEGGSSSSVLLGGLKMPPSNLALASHLAVGNDDITLTLHTARGNSGVEAEGPNTKTSATATTSGKKVVSNYNDSALPLPFIEIAAASDSPRSPQQYYHHPGVGGKKLSTGGSQHHHNGKPPISPRNPSLLTPNSAPLNAVQCVSPAEESLANSSMSRSEGDSLVALGGGAGGGGNAERSRSNTSSIGGGDVSKHDPLHASKLVYATKTGVPSRGGGGGGAVTPLGSSLTGRRASLSIGALKALGMIGGGGGGIGSNNVSRTGSIQSNRLISSRGGGASNANNSSFGGGGAGASFGRRLSATSIMSGASVGGPAGERNGVMRTQSKLSSSVLAYCLENDVTEEEAMELMAAERAEAEAAKEKMALLVAQQQAEEQQRRELLEKFGPIGCSEIFAEAATEGYRLAVEHLAREKKLQAAMKSKERAKRAGALGGHRSSTRVPQSTTKASAPTPGKFLGVGGSGTHHRNNSTLSTTSAATRSARGGGGGGGASSINNLNTNSSNATSLHPTAANTPAVHGLGSMMTMNRNPSIGSNSTAMLGDEPMLLNSGLMGSHMNSPRENQLFLSTTSAVAPAVLRSSSAHSNNSDNGTPNSRSQSMLDTASNVGGNTTPNGGGHHRPITLVVGGATPMLSAGIPSHSPPPPPASAVTAVGGGNSFLSPHAALLKPNLKAPGGGGNSSAVTPNTNLLGVAGPAMKKRASIAVGMMMEVGPDGMPRSPSPLAIFMPGEDEPTAVVGAGMLGNLKSAPSSPKGPTGGGLGIDPLSVSALNNAIQQQQHQQPPSGISTPTSGGGAFAGTARKLGHGTSAVNTSVVSTTSRATAATTTTTRKQPLSSRKLTHANTNNSHAPSTTMASQRHMAIHGLGSGDVSISNGSLTQFTVGVGGGVATYGSNGSNAYSTTAGSALASPRSDGTGGGDDLSSARSLRNMTDGEREALLKEEADIEARRTRERIRKYKRETQALMDADEVVANFEAQQMKRYINRVKQLHSTRNRLHDLSKDFQRKEAMRETEFKKKREAVYQGPLPDTRAVTPNRVWARINRSLVSEQDRLLAAETHQHTVDVATPILQFLSNHYRHPVAVKICERALRAVHDGSIDERAKGKVPYSELPGMWRKRGGDKEDTEDGTVSALTPTATTTTVVAGSSGGGKKGNPNDVVPTIAISGATMPSLTTTDPSGHQTAKIATLLTATRNYPKDSSQRLFADELFTLAGPTDLLCDDVVSVLVYTAMFFSITRDEVTLMMQDKARTLVMDHVKPLKKSLGVAV